MHAQTVKLFPEYEFCCFVWQLMSDFDFVVPIVLEQQHSVAMARQAKQFLYHFTYRATHSTQPAWAGKSKGSMEGVDVGWGVGV